MNFKNKILFYLMCAYIIIMPLIQEGVKFKGIPVSDLLLAVIVIVYFVKLIVDSSTRKNFIYGLKSFFTSAISLFMAAMLGIMIISILYAKNRGLAISESVRFLTYIFIYFVIRYEFKGEALIKSLLNCYIFVSAILGVFGIVQHFTTIGLDKKFVLWYSTTYSSGYKVVKIATTMYNPNAYAAYLILIIFPLIMLTIYENNKKKKGLYGIISMLILINIYMTYSRNALIGIGIGALVLCILYSWKLIIVFGGVGVLSMFIPSVFNRIKDFTNMNQNESRIKLWKTAITMIKEQPILGVGNGNFTARYNEYVDKYKWLKYREYRDYPTHNSYLKVQSELGIIGIVAFIGILITALLRVKKLFTITNDKFLKSFYMGAFASMIAFYVMNISDNLFFVPKATTYFWFILATCDSILENIEL